MVAGRMRSRRSAPVLGRSNWLLSTRIPKWNFRVSGVRPSRPQQRGMDRRLGNIAVSVNIGTKAKPVGLTCWSASSAAQQRRPTTRCPNVVVICYIPQLADSRVAAPEDGRTPGQPSLPRHRRQFRSSGSNHRTFSNPAHPTLLRPGRPHPAKKNRSGVRFNPKTGVGLVSARVSRAVFRALAENFQRPKQFREFESVSRAKGLDARRVQPHPRRVCSPTSVFGFNGRRPGRAHRNSRRFA